MPEPLTNVERKVYHYLIDFLAENTYQPSVRDICAKLRIKSTKTVSELLKSLENKGYVERNPARSRGVRLLGYERAPGTQPIPYYGRIAAGEPALLTENRKGFITIDRRFMPSETAFFLRISGESMIGRCVYDGDYVMIDPSATARDGDMVAARVEGGATVKTFTHRSKRVVLEPASPAEEEIAVEPDDDFSVLGVVCGVFRPFQELEVTREAAEESRESTVENG